MRITDYELSHLILRFEQEKDMKVMHCVQNLAALRDLVDARIEINELKRNLNQVIIERDLNHEQWKIMKIEWEKDAKNKL